MISYKGIIVGHTANFAWWQGPMKSIQTMQLNVANLVECGGNNVLTAKRLPVQAIWAMQLTATNSIKLH